MIAGAQRFKQLRMESATVRTLAGLPKDLDIACEIEQDHLHGLTLGHPSTPLRCVLRVGGGESRVSNTYGGTIAVKIS